MRACHPQCEGLGACIVARSKRGESAADATRRMLAAAGIELPESFEGALTDVDIERARLERNRPRPREVAPTPPIDARVERLLEVGWPRRAIEFARAARDTIAMRAIQRWEPEREAIVLAGPKGTGKTVAAAWCALQWRGPVAVRFARAATLLRLGRFERPRDPERGVDAWPDRWADVIAAPALCIDDLGAEYLDAKGSFIADLDELFDTFYSCRRPLIITTNLDARTFAERYGSRVLDRLTECATWAPCDGDSLRVRDPEPEPWED